MIARLAALALSALCFLESPIRAQGTPDYVVMLPSVGLAPGQSLRLTLFKPDGTPLRAEARVRHTGGANVCLGDGSVRFLSEGISMSFDFKRSDMPLAGEDRTGRLQLSPSLLISLDAPGTINGLAISMETISIADGTSNTVFYNPYVTVDYLVNQAVTDGTSNTIFFAEFIPSSQGSVAGSDLLLGGSSRDVLMGIGPGQSLRVTLANASASGAVDQQRPVNGHVKVFNGRGNLIAQSDEQVIPAGESRSFDFDRDEIALAGERGTNRAQVRIKAFFNSASEQGSPVLTSIELVDKSTGRTTVLSGQHCLVFYLGGTPR
jgi:prepilin-type processing-associated H-X9-DG protein